MNPKPVVRPVALVGLMGAGKSEVARALGETLGASVADLDAMIEAVEGASVAELFASAGEAWFRRRGESELLAQAVESGVRVIACGGGIVLDEARRSQLRERCDVVWLEVSPAEAARRVGAEPQRRRPSRQQGSPPRSWRTCSRHAPLYAEVATHRVNTNETHAGRGGRDRPLAGPARLMLMSRASRVSRASRLPRRAAFAAMLLSALAVSSCARAPRGPASSHRTVCPCAMPPSA